ncbi:hypothetical protein EBB07_20450 [Paenibacillaceae bacterium]|nr:hypothetical protein EBB07_20450 [Paenibacillaceae bacterium]
MKINSTPEPIYVEIKIAADLDTLWSHTQSPELHQQWDLRFTEITYLPVSAGDEVQHFRYRTRIGFGIEIAGTGEAKTVPGRAGEARMSTLAFGSDQRLSLIRSGSGYWKYTPVDGGIDFATRYNYQTRYGVLGRLVDRLLFRPLFGYATAWSFDVLRIWLEQRIPPAVSLQRALIHYLCAVMLAVLWCFQGLVPKLLFPEGSELELLRATGWFAGRELPFLQWLGGAEIALGLLTLLLHRRKWMYRGQIILLALLAAVALLGTPELLQAPFNPLTLNAAMIVLCLIAMMLSSGLPHAGRCMRRPSFIKNGIGKPVRKELL